MKRKAKERVIREQKLGRVAALVRSFEGSIPEDVDPMDACQRMLWQSVVLERVYATLIERDLGADWLTLVSYGTQGRRFEIHPYVKLWHEQQERVVKFGKALLDAGIAERQVRVAEDDGREIARIFQTVIFDVELQLSPEQQERMVSKVARLVPAA